MGRGGSECECPPEEISAHFSDVGKPPDDPDFCMNCLVEAQHWIAENFQNDIDDSPDLQADYHFSTKEVIDGFKKLKNSALGLDGISKSIIFPILAIICPAVAMLFTALLRFSVAPSDWRIAVLALIRKKGASKIDLNNLRAVHLLSFFYKWLTRCIRNRILLFVSDQMPSSSAASLMWEVAPKHCWLC